MFLLATVIECVFFLSVFDHQNITLFYFWNTYYSLSPWSYHEKADQKIGKTKNILVLKSYSTSGEGIGGRKKKKVKVKPQQWHILIIWKRSNKIKAVKTGVTLKVLCHWQSQNVELLFESTNLLK